MKAATREWVDKAEADFAAALVIRRSRKKHSRDIVFWVPRQDESLDPSAVVQFDSNPSRSPDDVIVGQYDPE